MPREPGAKRVPGTPPEGWAKTQFYATQKLVDEWDVVRQGMPGKVHKHMCTAAMALFLSLPRDVQENLYRWAHANELAPYSANSQEALLIVIEMMRQHIRDKKQDRPLNADEKRTVDNALKIIGDRSPSKEMAEAVQVFEIPDPVRLAEIEADLEAAVWGDDPNTPKSVRARIEANRANIEMVGKVIRKPMAVVDVNGPSASEAAKSLVDHLKKPPEQLALPSNSTHRVTKVVEPETKRGKGAA